MSEEFVTPMFYVQSGLPIAEVVERINFYLSDYNLFLTKKSKREIVKICTPEHGPSILDICGHLRYNHFTISGLRQFFLENLNVTLEDNKEAI